MKSAMHSMAQECVSLHRRPHPFRHATNQKRHPCRIQATPTAALAEEGRSLQERQRIAYPDMHVSRRGMLAAAAVFLGSSASEPASAAPDPSATAADFVDYENKQQGYRIQRPSAWNQTGKAGADVLFEDPSRKSSKLGVTVSPIRVDSLEAFGDLDSVAARLLAAEKAKDSTTGVEMVEQATRKGSQSGVTIYDFEYELDSTRGKKRVLNSVAISRRQLYIVNGAAKCDGGVCDGAAEAATKLMRRAAASFDIL